MKAFDDFKNKQKSIRSILTYLFLYVILEKFIKRIRA